MRPTGQAEAPGRIAQVRRWLANKFVKVAEFYRPLITQALHDWQGKDVFLILDGCSVNHETLQFFRLSLSYCYRALPLVWMVVARAGLIQVEACEALFEQAHQILPAVAAVTFLADRGFRDTDWAEKCLTMGWNYLIRVANNTYVTLADGRYLSIQQLNVPRGRCRYFTNVHLTQAKGFQCNLMITWTTPKKPGASPGELAQANLRYAEIRGQMAGISKESALPSDSAKQVLQKMQKLHLENLPIVKDNRFVFFANRGEILSGLITSYILEPRGQKPEVGPK